MFKPDVRVGAGLQERPEDVHVFGALLVLRPGLRIVGSRSPLGLQNGEQGGGAVGGGGQVGVSAVLEEGERYIELTVERGHQ